jgi:penicillin-binding protein 2
MLMAIAGLETGTVTPEDTVFCGGSAVHYGRTRLCWKRGGHGKVNLRQALTESCNVYFYQLGKDLGIDAIAKYGAMFRLGQPTGIDIPGEEKGILPSKTWKRETLHEPWYPGDTISVAIGQGYLAATPLQMANMAAAIANGGHLLVPHLRADVATESTSLPISDATLKLVRSALENVVREGTATRAALGRISVAGKTGTAQVYAHSAGVDSDDLPKQERDHAWFVGYAPADRPRVAFAVVVEHGGHGGKASAPIARKVLEVYFERNPEERKGGGPTTAG